MAHYRLFHFRDCYIAGMDEIEAAGDGEAVALAKTRLGSSTVEIWCGSRKVRTLAAPPPAPFAL